MEDRSNIQKSFYELGRIQKFGSGYAVKDLFVRWNERTATKQGPDGPETEYIYDAHVITLELPAGVEPGVEAVRYYIEASQEAIIALAQQLHTQEAGFQC